MEIKPCLVGLVSIMLAGVAVADSVTLRDGKQLEGSIFSKSDTQVYLVASDGTPQYIPLKDIARFEWRGKTEVLVAPPVATRPAEIKAAEPRPTPEAEQVTPSPAVVSAPAPVAALPTMRIEVTFSPLPPGDSRLTPTATIIREIEAAKKRIRIQAYGFSSQPIAKALIEAKKKGVTITAILDKSNQTATYSAATFLKNQGSNVVIDAVHAIAHNKIMLIDDDVIITGSFNFTEAAEKSNAENLLVIRGAPYLFSDYDKNFSEHYIHSKPYEGLTTPPVAVTTMPPPTRLEDETTLVRAPKTPVQATDDLTSSPSTPSSPRTSYGSGTPSGDRTATGLPIYTGPRGGRYHVSKNGNKVYEKKK